MKFIDIPGQDENVYEEILAAIGDIIRRGDFILGEESGELEEKLKEYLGTSEAILVSSGTDAMTLCLRALDLPKGSGVVTTPFTFFATTEVIFNEGLKPVYADIHVPTCNIDVDSLLTKIDSNTSAIMPVHIFGGAAEMDRIMKISSDLNIPVIEDCAQAFGAEFNGKMVGTFGKFGCYSFYPTKNLGAYGDAGLIVTDDRAMAEKIRVLRNQGADKPYRHKFPGFNSRCDTIQAAVLKAKLPHVGALNERRRQIAARYLEGLKDLNEISFPRELPDSKHVYHQFTIQTETRDALKKVLEEAGIPTAIYYDIGLHKQEVFERCQPAHLPNTDFVASRVLSLPIHPGLTNDDIDLVISNIRKFFNV